MKSDTKIRNQVFKEILSILDEEPYDVLYNTHNLRKYIKSELDKDNV